MPISHDSAKCIDRTADQIAAQEQQLEEAQERMSDDLFEAYFAENGEVVTEVDFILADPVFFKAMREAYTSDGIATRSAFRKHVAMACDEMAGSFATIEAIEAAYRVYGV